MIMLYLPSTCYRYVSICFRCVSTCYRCTSLFVCHCLEDAFITIWFTHQTTKSCYKSDCHITVQHSLFNDIHFHQVAPIYVPLSNTCFLTPKWLNQFRGQICMGPRKHVLNRGIYGRQLANTVEQAMLDSTKRSCVILKC